MCFLSWQRCAHAATHQCRVVKHVLLCDYTGRDTQKVCLSFFEFCSMHLFSLILSVSFSCSNYNHEDNSESGDVTNSSTTLSLGMVLGYPNTGTYQWSEAVNPSTSETGRMPIYVMLYRHVGRKRRNMGNSDGLENGKYS